MFNRKIFFDVVRGSLFHGAHDAERKSMAWRTSWRRGKRTRAPTICATSPTRSRTTAHETGFTMQPIEEYGKGSGMEYGKPDPETGQTYYGRGYVQLTWRDNYARADEELGFGHEG